MFAPKAHKIFADLNFQEAPSCTTQNDKSHHPPFIPMPLSAFTFEQFCPRQVGITVLKNQEDDLIENKKDSTDDMSISNDPGPRPKSLFVVEKTNGSNQKIFHHFSENEITEFNTNPKLRKIHSTYHLKRKFTTKFQNDIKSALNKLISNINMNYLDSSSKLPFVAQNTKGFREDVKIESLQKIKDLTIAKYISEETQVAGRSLNWDNYSLNEKVIQLYSKDKSKLIKCLYEMLNKTVVFDYYSNFLSGERFKKCFEKDMLKYKQKLEGMKFSKSKMDVYMAIFREKYTGIAKNYFSL